MQSNHPFFSRKLFPLWKRSEKVLARLLGGRLTPASGGTPQAQCKGDVISDDVLCEVKTTEKNSFSLHYSDLAKVCRQANAVGKAPVFQINFVRESVEVWEETAWVMLPLSIFRGEDR